MAKNKNKSKQKQHDAEVQARPGGAGQEAGPLPKMKRKAYERQMRVLHGELVALQEWVKTSGWTADDKKRSRLNIISHLLSQVPYKPLAPGTSRCPNGSTTATTWNPACRCGTSRHCSRQPPGPGRTRCGGRRRCGRQKDQQTAGNHGHAGTRARPR